MRRRDDSTEEAAEKDACVVNGVLTRSWSVAKAAARGCFGRARVAIGVVLLTSIGIFLALEIYAIAATGAVRNTPLPTTFGNFERVRELLSDDGGQDAFSFAVAGDTQGCGTFERIVDELRDEPLSFMVLLGDCVRDSTLGHHAYFRAELAKELATPYPMFYVVGNHEVHPEGFSLSQFESAYGPTNFFFKYRNCLFIFLRTLQTYPTDETVEFLERVLSTHVEGSEKVFAFMHIPALESATFHARDYEGKEKLVSLFERHGVDYAFAGDYHGYARGEVNGTVYLVSGGGGSHLKESKFGAFHHAMVLRVEPNAVHERILFVDRNENLEDRLERLALGDVYPWLSASRIAAMALNVAVVALAAWAIRHLLKIRRPSVS